jgi:hypothetical protein
MIPSHTVRTAIKATGFILVVFGGPALKVIGFTISTYVK